MSPISEEGYQASWLMYSTPQGRKSSCKKTMVSSSNIVKHWAKSSPLLKISPGITVEFWFTLIAGRIPALQLHLQCLSDSDSAHRLQTWSFEAMCISFFLYLQLMMWDQDWPYLCEKIEASCYMKSVVKIIIHLRLVPTSSVKNHYPSVVWPQSFPHARNSKSAKV